MLLVGEVDTILEGLVHRVIEYLPDTLYDILAIFGRIDDPAYVLLKCIGTSLALVKTTLTVNQEDLLHHSQDIEKELSL